MQRKTVQAALSAKTVRAILSICSFTVFICLSNTVHAECTYVTSVFAKLSGSKTPMSYLLGDLFCARDFNNGTPFLTDECIQWKATTDNQSRYYHAEILELGIEPAIVAEGSNYAWVQNPNAPAPAWIEFEHIGRFERFCP